MDTKEVLAALRKLRMHEAKKLLQIHGGRKLVEGPSDQPGEEGVHIQHWIFPGLNGVIEFRKRSRAPY